jgi:hypothetical protein
MQSIPVDVSRLGTLRCVVAPEAKTNFETGEIRVSRDGVAQWTVGVSVRQLDSRRTSIIEITVPGEPVGVEEGAPVVVAGLVAFVWEQGGRHGTSFRADSITPTANPGAAPRASAVQDTKGGKSGGAA